MSHAKPVEERAGGQPRVDVVKAAPAGLTAPAVPEHLRLDDDLCERWVAVWTSPVAQVLDPVSDLEPMARLFQLYVLDRRLARAVQNHIDDLPGITDEDYVYDDKLVRSRLSVASEIRQLEQTLGVSPRGRLTIGLAVLNAGKAAQDQGREVHDDADD